MQVSPLIFEPIYKPKIWGGDRIFAYFGRTRTTTEPIGESWELADLEADQSRVRIGPHCGRTLGELRADWGRDLMGDVPLFEGRFPLLIKFLDAQMSLSVQVHPTAAVARKLGGSVRVKNEAWYVLAAEHGGVIYHGLQPGVTAEVFREAMLGRKKGSEAFCRDGPEGASHKRLLTPFSPEGVLRQVPVHAGQCYYLPSGTVHALGAGVLVAEIQTPSDVTYRTYDWGRIDPVTGEPRPLHLEAAMECIDFAGPQPEPTQPPMGISAVSARIARVAACESFAIDRVEMRAGARRQVPGGRPIVWIVLQGTGRIEGTTPIAFTSGDVILLPAALTEVHAYIESPTAYLEVTVPR